MSKQPWTEKIELLKDSLGELSHPEKARKTLQAVEQELSEMKEANEVLENYNQSLQMKMADRTEELQSLLDKLKEEQAFQVAYNNLVTSLNSSVELKNLLKDALQGTLRFSESQVGIFYLFDDSSQSLTAVEWVGVSPEKKSFNLGEGLPGQAAEEKRNIVISEIPEDCNLHIEAGIFSGPPKSVGYFPILYRDDLLGLFELGSLEPYRDKLLHHLESAQVQVAISIHNALLYQQSREMAMKFKNISEKLREKNQALEVQQRLLAEQKKELDFKNRELKQSSEQKSNFLATMSHELRTPLNSIIGYTDLVLKKAGGDLGKHKKKLEKVLNNAQHLLSLINNILDLSKIEAGKMELFVEEFEINKLVHNCLATGQGLVEGKPIQLVEDVDNEIPQLRTDQSKLKQVLINLIGNASKFTEEGAITVSAQFLNGRDDWIRISVRDTGPGIPDEKLRNIFDSFTQVDNSSSRRHGGTGLGLAIVKRMTQLMHGSVSVESEMGEGSVFHLDIPIDVYDYIMGGGKGPIDGEEKEISLTAEDTDISDLPQPVGTNPAQLAASAQAKEEKKEKKAPTDHLESPLEKLEKEKRKAEEEEKEAKEGEAKREEPETSLKARATTRTVEEVSLSQEESEYLDPEKIGQAREEGKKLVLIVDDDPVVHDLFTHYLENTDYYPLGIEEGDRALNTALKYQPFAIFLDIILKNSNGWEVLQSLKSEPSLSQTPVIVSSNIDNSILAENMGASSFLSKPVSKDEILKILKALEEEKEQKQTASSAVKSSDQRVCVLASLESPLCQKLQDKGSPFHLAFAETSKQAVQIFSELAPPEFILLDLIYEGKKQTQKFEEILLNLPVLEAQLVCLVDPDSVPAPKVPDLADEVIYTKADSLDLDQIWESISQIGKSSPFGTSAPAEETPSKSTSSGQKKKILVVEDVPDNLEFVCDVLGDEYEMICARDGQEGVDKAIETEPDLILMDLLLPNIDGLEATKMIRDNPGTSQIPIIALTAHAMVGDREKALKSGCVDYLTKPIVEDVLRRRVGEILEQYG